MATTAPSKRISRLRLREPSMKAAPEKKPKKLIATNKNSKKIDVSARNKSLRASKGNVSLLKNSRISRLRPRRNRKNYCEDSRLLQQYIQPKQQDSVVILEKLIVEDDKKVPVYKAMKPSEKFLEDKTDVYDFKFDANDTREKAKKKTKRNVNKGKSKTKKMTHKKVTSRPKTTGRPKVTKSLEPDKTLSVEIAQNNPPVEFVIATKLIKKDVKKIEISEINTDIQTLEESVNKDIVEETESSKVDAEDIQTTEKSTEDIVEKLETPRADTNIQSVEKTTLPARKFVKQIKKKSPNKPRVVSIENADSITIIKSPSNNSEDSWPFRPKNIFNNKISLKEHNSTLKCSLLTKTLSPILKTANTLDLGSPWRPPTLMFSQTKHFIQSTPYKKFETNKENKEINKKSMETNKENMEMNKENMTLDKENIDMNKENKGRRDKERKKKAVGLRKKNAIQRKFPISENQPLKKVRAAVASKPIVQPAPARISLGEIKNLLQRSNVNGDNKQTIDQAHTEVDKSHNGVDQKNKQLLDVLNFSDTFDVLSETERLSNIGNDAPLFMDLEPSHFSKVFINITFLHVFIYVIFILLLIMFI